MGLFNIHIDVAELTKEMGALKKEVEQTLIQSARSLASMTHAKLGELATEKLGSLASKYKNEIEFSNPEENLWVVTLKEAAMWIEEGRKGGFQEELLRGKSAKTAKDGSRYAVIPFEHSKPLSEQGSKARELSGQIKAFLKDKGISYKKIEYNADGSPRVGLLHKFDIESARPSARAKDPALKGVSIYQSVAESGQVKRSVMTFRVISDKHRAEGKWFHPGMDGKKLVDQVHDWALREWENTILPSVFKEFNK